MSDEVGQDVSRETEGFLKETGLAALLDQLGTLQSSMTKVADGMEALGQNAVRQNQDTDNLAAHVIAIEAVLTVMLRQMPIDLGEVRAEAERRASSIDGGSSAVVQLAEDLIKRAED